MNIDGLSEETIEKFINSGYIKEPADIYKLNRYEDEIVATKGFGRKSYDKLRSAIEASRETNLVRVIYGLGIEGIGLSNAKVLCKHFDYELERMRSADKEELVGIEGIGDIIAEAVIRYFANEDNKRELDNLLCEVNLNVEKKTEVQAVFEGMVFVVTGSVNHFANRNEVKDKVEELGGKVTGSVTSKTNYLINNDINSSSSKNKKAKELGVPIITEEEFIKMLPEN